MINQPLAKPIGQHVTAHKKVPAFSITHTSPSYVQQLPPLRTQAMATSYPFLATSFIHSQHPLQETRDHPHHLW